MTVAIPVSSKVGIKFLGDTRKMEVHGLINEKPQCRIDEIIRAGGAVSFDPDTVVQAHKEDYNNCPYCIGGTRK